MELSSDKHASHLFLALLLSSPPFSFPPLSFPPLSFLLLSFPPLSWADLLFLLSFLAAFLAVNLKHRQREENK